MRILVIAYLVFTLSCPALAQDIVPLMPGERAPHSGTLVKERRFKKLLEAEIAVSDLQGKLAIQTRMSTNVETIYDKKLAEATREDKWYETPEFNRWLGFGIGVLLTSLAVYGAAELKR